MTPMPVRYSGNNHHRGPRTSPPAPATSRIKPASARHATTGAAMSQPTRTSLPIAAFIGAKCLKPNIVGM
jgi:hypothetical protein